MSIGKKIKFRLVALGVLILGLFFLNGCAYAPRESSISEKFLTSSASPAASVGSELRVIFLDVGQGDSSLIITPEQKTILIDGGPNDKVLSGLGKFLPLRQKKIDVMILTHPHSDHLDGLVDVLGRYEVGEIYYTGVLHTTGTFLEWLKIIKEKNIKMNIVKEKSKTEVGGVTVEFLYPDRDLSVLAPTDFTAARLKDLKLDNLNNTSLALKLIFGRTQFLFMGDAEVPVEKYLLSEDADLRADVLKVGHHGSNSSTGEELLKKISPQYAVISAGKDNDFGHPHLRTMRRLERFGVQILRTDESGNIEMKSDGLEISFFKK